MEPLSFDENIADTADTVLSQPFNQLKLSEMNFRQMFEGDSADTFTRKIS